MSDHPAKTVIVSGGTTGMGRAVALQRLRRGDHVTVIGSDPAKGEAMLHDADDPRLRFFQADLSSIAEVERVVGQIFDRHEHINALVLCANRVVPRRTETPEGLEATFALYYLSRYLLAHQLSPLLTAASQPVVINVAGVGNTAGRIVWEDPQFTRGYSQILAQLQAGRANDLLGVSLAARGGDIRHVLYHPGFTRTGCTAHPNPLVRGAITLLSRLFARPLDDAVAPIVDWIDRPPAETLQAVDRGRIVDRDLPTLDPQQAARLAAYTEELIQHHGPAGSGTTGSED